MQKHVVILKGMSLNKIGKLGFFPGMGEVKLPISLDPLLYCTLPRSEILLMQIDIFEVAYLEKIQGHLGLEPGSLAGHSASNFLIALCGYF